MKLTNYFIAILIITITACNHVKDPNTATIDFSQAVDSVPTFLFSTCQGKTLIIADASTAQQLNDNIKKQTGGSFSDMGVGNAFALNMDGKIFLCTATHAAIGLPGKHVRNIGADIAIIDLDMMSQDNQRKGFDLSDAYEMDTIVNTSDSVFVRGYLFNEKGELQSVVVSGAGRVEKKSEFYNDTNHCSGPGLPYVQQRTFILELDENIELAGLSGSPAFNKQGKIIGVYSGRTIEQNGSKYTYSIRISLFN